MIYFVLLLFLIFMVLINSDFKLKRYHVLQWIIVSVVFNLPGYYIYYMYVTNKDL